MAVQSAVTEKTYQPGSAMAWESLGGIVFLDAGELHVEHWAAGASAGTLLARDVHYALQGDGTTGNASIRSLAAWGAGDEFRIRREGVPLQPEVLPRHQPLKVKDVELGLDRLTLRVQEILREAGRALKFPRGEAGKTLPSVAARRGRYLMFDAVYGDPVAAPTIPPSLGSLDPEGINLWEYAKGDGVTNDTAAINAVIELASVLGIAKINCGGPKYTYLLGGPFEQMGIFTTWDGSTVPFNRHKVRLRSNIHLVGCGATFKLSGGSVYPGSIFGHPFYDGELLENVKIEGLTWDGNMANQIVPAIPANQIGPGHVVWQHGHGLIGRVHGLEVKNCKLQNIRGYGILAVGDVDNYSRDVFIHHNEFVNVFTCAASAQNYNCHIHDNYIHGDGFWVCGIQLETFDPDFQPTVGVRIYNNVYDYRDGRAPVESVPQYATDSPEAEAGRPHLRKAISCNSPSNPGNTVGDVVIENELIFQGTMTISLFNRVKIKGNRFRNTYEDMTGILYGNTAAIFLSGYGTNIYDCDIADNDVISDLDGAGIFVNSAQSLTIRGGRVVGPRAAAIRLERCSGIVESVMCQDYGMDDSAMELPGSRAAAITVFGGQMLTLTIKDIHAVETRAGAERKAVHLAHTIVDAYPLVRLKDCVGDGLLGALVQDVGGNLVQSGNMEADLPQFVANRPVVQLQGATVFGLIVDVAAGTTAVTYRAPAGENINVSYIAADSGLEVQQQYLGATGDFRTMMFNAGVLTGIPIICNNDGTATINDGTP